MDKYGQLWANMRKYGQIWANMDKYGQIWTNTGKYGQIWTNMGIYAQIWTNVEAGGGAEPSCKLHNGEDARRPGEPHIVIIIITI